MEPSTKKKVIKKKVSFARLHDVHIVEQYLDVRCSLTKQNKRREEPLFGVHRKEPVKTNDGARKFDLPEDWCEIICNKGTFYRNDKKNISQWEYPQNSKCYGETWNWQTKGSRRYTQDLREKKAKVLLKKKTTI